MSIKTFTGPIPSKLTQIVLAALLVGIVIAGYPNFHQTSPGVLYRSKQLSGKQLDFYIHKFGIKTVINLRGASPEAAWYRAEMAVARNDGIAHFDIPLSAVRYVPPSKLDSIIKIGQASPKPILVHCMGGADRSGLFCAAWELKVEGLPPEKADKQLSFVYGHIPSLGNHTEAMDSSFHDYARFLAVLR